MGDKWERGRWGVAEKTTFKKPSFIKVKSIQRNTYL